MTNTCSTAAKCTITFSWASVVRHIPLYLMNSTTSKTNAAINPLQDMLFRDFPTCPSFLGLITEFIFWLLQHTAISNIVQKTFVSHN